jgi:LPS sulfotransferase NodH
VQHGFRRPYRTVLVATSRRSGSTLLGEALHRAGGLGCPLEYLHPGFRVDLAARWGEPELPGYLRALYRYRIDATGTLGIKLFWPDLLLACAERHPDEAELFQTNLVAEPGARERVYARVRDLIDEVFPRPRFVFLWRVDQLRQAISDCRAMRGGRWRALEPHDAPRPDLDQDEVTGRIAAFAYQRQQWRDWFGWAGVTPHEVTYERLVATYPQTCRQLATRLGGVDPAAAAAVPRLLRQSDGWNERAAIRYLTTLTGKGSG